MTSEQLASLPVGSIVYMTHDDMAIERGEIIQAGLTVHIMWPESNVTNYVDTRTWGSFIEWLEVE